MYSSQVVHIHSLKRYWTQPETVLDTALRSTAVLLLSLNVCTAQLTCWYFIRYPNDYQHYSFILKVFYKSKIASKLNILHQFLLIPYPPTNSFGNSTPIKCNTL